MKKLFGTDGMRGVAGEFPLDAHTVYIAGRALARHFKRESDSAAPRFVIGRDTRKSGAWLEAAFARGAREAGAHVESAGVLTTPGIAFLCGEMRMDAGIVISASHNPYEDNGVKIFTRCGRKLDDRIERFIEAEIHAAHAPALETNEDKDSNQNRNTNGVKDADAETTRALQTKYLDYLFGVAGDLRLDGLSIVADCANGAAYDVAPKLLARLGAQCHIINATPDGRNINHECGSLHLEVLQRTVREKRADFGVAFDGDADRALFVDERGEIVDGDATLWILAKALQTGGAFAHNTVVATVMSNIGLERALSSRDIKLVRAAVGDKYVLEELMRTGAALGGEQSGHIILPGESLVGDGLRTMLHVLRAMRAKDESLSSLAREFVRYPQILVNVRVRDKRPFDDVPAIARAAREIESALGTNGRLLLRYSGTESLARVMIEGADVGEITATAHDLANIIKAELSA
ncbi:MAG: phosphoglucosamine mutase [Pyrinomonadaceae bacterium MAG19_C2-C3]|nr:phosphoglucosamine mutase [Pyrinomonadaceae bacterium MAG19_C2-C3]